MEKSHFNSYIDREDYAVVKDEAFRLGLTVRQHISNIVTAYVTHKRKEESISDIKPQAEALEGRILT